MTDTEKSYLFKYDSYRLVPSNQLVSVGGTSTSVDSVLIPVFAGKEGTVLRFEGIQEKTLVYNLFKSPSPLIGRSLVSYRILPDQILRYQQIRYISRYTPLVYYSFKEGMFYMNENGNPVVVFTLAVEKEYYLTMTPQTVDLSKFVFVVSKEFKTIEHKFMFSKVKKHIYESGFDVLETDSVEKWCFRNDIRFPSFSTVEDRLSYLSNIKNFL